MFVSETLSFLSVDIVEQLYVDSTPAEQRVDVNFDITFPRLPCSGSNSFVLVLIFFMLSSSMSKLYFLLLIFGVNDKIHIHFIRLVHAFFFIT